MGTIANPETSITQDKPSEQRVVRYITLASVAGQTIAAALTVRSVDSGPALMADTAHPWESLPPPAVGPVFQNK